MHPNHYLVLISPDSTSWTMTDDSIPLGTRIVGFLLESAGVTILYLFAGVITWLWASRRRPGTPFSNYVPATVFAVATALRAYARSISIIGDDGPFRCIPEMVSSIPHMIVMACVVFPSIWGLSVLISARIQAPSVAIDRSRITWAKILAGTGIVLWWLADGRLYAAAQALHSSCR
jgi:hypothetical protein